MSKKQKLLIISLFIILFLWGLSFIPKVNANYDEIAEENILLSNIKDYSESFHIEKIAKFIDQKEIPAISENSEKDHGISAYYLFSPLVMLRDKYPHLISILWHIYTYCLFFSGVIFFYLLMLELFNNNKTAVIMALLYFISPRILIDGMHNNKDIVFMSMIMIMIYFGYRLIKNTKYSDCIFFSIACAISCNTKIIGIYFAFIIGLTYLVYKILEKKWDKKSLRCGLLIFFMSLLLYFIFTPAIWGTGKIKLIEFVNYCLTNGVNFRGKTTVLFEGTRYVTTNNPLPWYYLPKLIVITLPIPIILLFIYSFSLIIYKTIRNIKARTLQNYLYIEIVILFLTFIGIAILKKPNIYNGWRHFYFLYALILIIVSDGVKILLSGKFKKILLLIIIGTLLINFYYIEKYGVANTAYYNILVGRNDLSKKYELDYYDVTGDEAIKKFLKSEKYEDNKDGKLYLYGTDFNYGSLITTYAHTNQWLKNKLVVLNEDSIQEFLDNGKIVYYLANSTHTTENLSKYEKIYSYKIFNSEIINFYKMQ